MTRALKKCTFGRKVLGCGLRNMDLYGRGKTRWNDMQTCLKAWPPFLPVFRAKYILESVVEMRFQHQMRPTARLLIALLAIQPATAAWLLAAFVTRAAQRHAATLRLPGWLAGWLDGRLDGWLAGRNSLQPLAAWCFVTSQGRDRDSWRQWLAAQTTNNNEVNKQGQ